MTDRLAHGKPVTVSMVRKATTTQSIDLPGAHLYPSLAGTPLNIAEITFPTVSPVTRNMKQRLVSPFFSGRFDADLMVRELSKLQSKKKIQICAIFYS